MTTLVTGSRGHLGEGLVRRMQELGEPVRGVDRLPSPFTDVVADLRDPKAVRAVMQGVQRVCHAATLHKPHVATHSWQDFLDTNLTATKNLLEAAVEEEVESFVFTSTTSTFGRAMNPGPNEPAVWVEETLVPIPKNIYGVTKVAAEDLGELAHVRFGLPVVVLRTSRFFPEEDDVPERRAAYPDENLKANEFLNRRLDLFDAVEGHRLALDKASALGFEKLILSAPTPFTRADVQDLRKRADELVEARCPGTRKIYQDLGWSLPREISRVYDASRARRVLGWIPRLSFSEVIARAHRGEPIQSSLAQLVGKKPYHESP